MHQIVLEYQQLPDPGRHGHLLRLRLHPVLNPPHLLFVQERRRSAFARVVQIELDRHLSPVAGPVRAPVLAVHVGFELVPRTVLEETHAFVEPDDGAALVHGGDVGLDAGPELGGEVSVVDDAALAVTVAGDVDANGGARVDEGDFVALCLGAGDQGVAFGGGEDVLDGEGDDREVLAGGREEWGDVEGFGGWWGTGEVGGVVRGEDVLEDGGLWSHGGFFVCYLE